MKILIAEDDYVSRLLLKKSISAMDHEVLEAVDGQQGLDLFQENEPSMVITDWMMPKIDGLELCKKIRSSGKKTYTYIMLLTAKDKISDLVEVFAAGADDYITKPFKPDELKSRIKTGERILTLEHNHHKLQQEMTEKNFELDKALKDLKETQSQILQSEKMASIGQLAAGVAHEINNPIGFVGSNLSTLTDYLKDFNTLLGHYNLMKQNLKDTDLEKLPDNIKIITETIEKFEEEIDIDYLKDDIPELLGDCAEGTERVRKIVADLKNFAHPGNDKIKLVNVNQGIESTLNVVSNEIKYKAQVIKEFGEIPLVEGYPQQINQVFMNILVNAAQAIEEKGEIHIKTQQDNKDVKITISDNGSGIEEKNIAKIFDPFFTTKPVGKGTGLGMNIAYNIIKKHKGTIDIKSKVGSGTTFTIILPGK
ncbi:MAG: response regulator [Desulfobacterales bacterium]|nr:response regulator [Desulfobacterales bacterium]